MDLNEERTYKYISTKGSHFYKTQKVIYFQINDYIHKKKQFTKFRFKSNTLNIQFATVVLITKPSVVILLALLISSFGPVIIGVD